MKPKHLALLLVLAMLLTGCGAASKTGQSAPRENGYAADMEMPSAEESKSEALAGSGTTGSQALPEGRKWVVTVEMSAETEDLDALLTSLDQTIGGLNGYVEDQNVYNGSTHASYRRRSASMTVRIPAEDVNSFTAELSGIANVVSQNQRRDDITLTYVSTESRVTALRTEEARLLELMEKAETMSDLLEIESRLTDVRYELERYASQLRVFDNQVDYATIYLSIEEVQKYTPVEEPTVLERITGGFTESVEDLWEGLVDLFVWIVVSSPFLVVWALVITAVVLIWKRIFRRRPVKKAPRQMNENPENKTE